MSARRTAVDSTDITKLMNVKSMLARCEPFDFTREMYHAFTFLQLNHTSRTEIFGRHYYGYSLRCFCVCFFKV